MSQLGARVILMRMLEFLVSNWVQLGVHAQLLEIRTGIGIVFHTYITHEKKNYKLMTGRGSCANIIAKTTLEKMGLKAELHPNPYNMNWDYLVLSGLYPHV